VAEKGAPWALVARPLEERERGWPRAAERSKHGAVRCDGRGMEQQAWRAGGRLPAPPHGKVGRQGDLHRPCAGRTDGKTAPAASANRSVIHRPDSQACAIGTRSLRSFVEASPYPTIR